jgi:hypothetical protein
MSSTRGSEPSGAFLGELLDHLGDAFVWTSTEVLPGLGAGEVAGDLIGHFAVRGRTDAPGDASDAHGSVLLRST